MKIQVHADTCKSLFIAALFTNDPDQKLPKCPSSGERRNKVCNVYTMEYHLAIKKKYQIHDMGETQTICAGKEARHKRLYTAIPLLGHSEKRQNYRDRN